MLNGTPALNTLTEGVIGAAVEVHRCLGPGLPENAYEEALAYELSRRSIDFVRQPVLPIRYKDRKVGECRFDLLVANSLIVEIKAVEILSKLHEAQLNTYLRLANQPFGLLINFNVPKLTTGLRRVANRSFASPPSEPSPPSVSKTPIKNAS
jgi:GxxExxY protein